MARKIKIRSPSIGTVYAILLIERSPKTYRVILDSLLLPGEANIWGDEVYFPVGINIEPEALYKKLRWETWHTSLPGKPSAYSTGLRLSAPLVSRKLTAQSTCSQE